jgi:hypothetical protein
MLFFLRCGEAREDVERALHRRAFDAGNLLHRVEHHAPRVVDGNHLANALLRASERGDAGGHREAGGGLRAVRLIDARQLDDRLWAGQPAQAPAGHCIGLAEAVDDDRAFGHARLCGQAEMTCARRK